MTEQPKQTSSDQTAQGKTVSMQHQAGSTPTQSRQQGGFTSQHGQIHQSGQAQQPRFTDWASI